MDQWHTTLQSRELISRITEHLLLLDLPPVRFMEVCGTHTMAIAKYALRDLMPETITLTSGPGCPVCVTSTNDIDTFIAASRIPNVIITTFGDLIRVPGSDSSLQKEMSQGNDIRVVYSPLDALDLARTNPQREVIFLGVGFETTTPTVAAAILTAKKEK
ncbi:MAG: hydrogenase formation protein HypD, partial [Desulfobulbaceae bacterium]|nr:hydrogenase formation protein HypD [Desulfobulbaceae bacterium]